MAVMRGEARRGRPAVLDPERDEDYVDLVATRW
jgi:hypothetical protein